MQVTDKYINFSREFNFQYQEKMIAVFLKSCQKQGKLFQE